MINNRQGGGRRRGRGGQRNPNMGGGPAGNRQDNRQRGNAAQLLEKYKNMARDAQLAGDRVQTEYYLQFADHYFRVLSENRARFEEQNPRRGRDDDMDDDEGDEDFIEAGEDTVADERPQRQERPERPERFNRRERPRREDREERVARDAGDGEQRQTNGGGETIPFDILPPAIARDDSDSDSGEEAAEEKPRPRRRRTTRATRPSEGEGEIAPAA